MHQNVIDVLMGHSDPNQVSAVVVVVVLVVLVLVVHGSDDHDPYSSLFIPHTLVVVMVYIRDGIMQVYNTKKL